MQSQPVLLDLCPDLLRSTAQWLAPKDRLSLALSSKRLFNDTWGDFAEEDLTSRYSFESRIELDLDVRFEPSRFGGELGRLSIGNASSSQSHNLRLVPHRLRMQHCFVAVSSCGRLVAVLAYDNILRVIKSRTKTVVATTDVGLVCGVDVWDKEARRQVPQRNIQSDTNNYEERNGVDAEIGFGFTSDNKAIYISSRPLLRLFEIQGGTEASIVLRQSLDVRNALRFLDASNCIGGSCAVSPSGSTAAWVVFADSPAVAYISIWDIQEEKCVGVLRVSQIHRRPFSGLGWARAEFTPNGRHVLCIVNNGKKKVRTVRIGNTFQRLKLSEYVFAVLEVKQRYTARANADALAFKTISTKRTWLDLSPEVYPHQFALSIQAILRQMACRDDIHARQTNIQELRLPRLCFNFVHSCPTEATYKAISRDRSPPWLVSKQPMFSIAVDPSGSRAMTATSSHANAICRMLCSEEPMSHVTTEETPQASTRDTHFAFKGMPWRAGFASASAFSLSGKWLAGATLLEDTCVVCVRNVTHQEHFGRYTTGFKKQES